MGTHGITDPAVEDIIESLFMVEDRYLDKDLPTFVVKPIGVGDKRQLLKDEFKQLAQDLKPFNYLPKLEKVVDSIHIIVLRKPPARPPRYTVNLILLAATTGTIFLDGFLRSNSPIMTIELMPGFPILLNALLFTAAILGIFGLHEFGHKAIASRAGTEASMPYFIPAPPGLGGTFGAVITQREPPVNRDALFDLGFSGPFTGFLVTIIVAIVGASLSFIVPVNEMYKWIAAYPEIGFQSIPFPLLIQNLFSLVRPAPGDTVIILHPVAFAAWVGCLVTFINLMPSWQLDGGHVSRALLGEPKQRIVTLVGIAVLLLSGYVTMAIMIAVFMMLSRGKSDAPLDDVSPLSFSRRLLTLVYLAMIVLTFVAIPLF